jgi:hypothetical protein
MQKAMEIWPNKLRSRLPANAFFNDGMRNEKK